MTHDCKAFALSPWESGENCRSNGRGVGGGEGRDGENQEVGFGNTQFKMPGISREIR